MSIDEDIKEMCQDNILSCMSSITSIQNYIESFNVLDKAGAYNIEDAENILIKHIDGCYNNIVGFPLKKFKMSKIKTILDNL